MFKVWRYPRVRQIPLASSLFMTAILRFGFVWSIASTTCIAELVPIEIRSYSFIASPELNSFNLHNPMATLRPLLLQTMQPYIFEVAISFVEHRTAAQDSKWSHFVSSCQSTIKSDIHSLQWRDWPASTVTNYVILLCALISWVSFNGFSVRTLWACEK